MWHQTDTFIKHSIKICYKATTFKFRLFSNNGPAPWHIKKLIIESQIYNNWSNNNDFKYIILSVKSNQTFFDKRAKHSNATYAENTNGSQY